MMFSRSLTRGVGASLRSVQVRDRNNRRKGRQYDTDTDNPVPDSKHLCFPVCQAYIRIRIAKGS
jgi:hypothetical protein